VGRDDVTPVDGDQWNGEQVARVPIDERPSPEAAGLARLSRTGRIKDRQRQAVASVERARTRLEQARPRSKTVDAAFRALEHDVETGGGVLSGAVAFRTFLFMVPYVFVLVAGFGIASGASKTDPGDLARSAGVSGLVAHAIKGAADYSFGQRLFAVALGGFALFLAARAAVKVLRVVHSLMWGVPIQRSKHTNRDALVFIGAVTLMLSVVALVGRLRSESFAVGLVASLLLVAVPFGFWLWASWNLPREDVTLWALIPGAALVGIGTEVLHLVTVYWIAREVTHKSDTYGALGASLALLLWAYLLGRLITASAVLNATLWHRNQARNAD
jgi:uncharacterized BrkB/YihY/UPF0761 family membrane protein